MEASHNKNAGMNYLKYNQLFYYEVRVVLMKTYIEDNDLDDKVNCYFQSIDQQCLK
jgi:hypothetical protein